MKIPVHVVNDQKAFREIIDHEKAEIIMVDTSGRSIKTTQDLRNKELCDTIDYDSRNSLCKREHQEARPGERL